MSQALQKLASKNVISWENKNCSCNYEDRTNQKKEKRHLPTSISCFFLQFFFTQLIFLKSIQEDQTPCLIHHVATACQSPKRLHYQTKPNAPIFNNAEKILKANIYVYM